jgi:hypothetical protein
LGLALLSGDALAQQKSVKDQLVGTWTLVSTIDVHPDGRKIDRYGPNVRGILMFDTSGRYAQFITRPDLPKFAAGTVDKGTPEEMRAVLESFVGGFGTYSVNEAEKTLLTRVEGNVFPNVVGVEQKRIILSLTADELKYTNPATTRGIGAEATWRRVK